MYIGNATESVLGRNYIGRRPGLFTGDVPVNLLVLSTINITLSATRYAVGYGNLTIATTENQCAVPEDCTIDFMSANVNANPNANIVYTLRKNGNDTPQTVTLTTGTQQATDSAHPVHFRKGDTFSVKLVSGALGVSTIDGTVCLRFVRYGTNQALPCLWQQQDNSAAGSFCSGLDMSSLGMTVPFSQCPYPATSIMVDTVRDTAANTQGSVMYKNGIIVPFDHTIGGLPNPEARQASPFDLLAGETFICSNQSLTTPATMRGGRMMAQPLGSTLYPKAPFQFSANPMATNTTRFMGTNGRLNNVPTPNGSLVESEMQFIPPPCKVRELYGYIDTLPPAGQTVTLFLRKNGVNTALSAQFTNASANVVFDTANEATFNGTTDLASIATVGTATSGTRYINGTLQIYRTTG